MTVITYGNTTHMCLQAAEKISLETGAGIEVIDLRSLVPWDKETVIKSVKKTGKVLVVHEDKVFSGFGAEIGSTITEEAFEYLDGPVRRVGSTFTPVGFNRILEKAILPDTEKIEKAMRGLLDY
jgi:2-oxoisovalerate dehydrogenase E1 component